MATIVALVAIGSVSAAPAFAANVSLTVIDDSTGAPYGPGQIYFAPTNGDQALMFYAESDGVITVADDSLPAGEYIAKPVNGVMAPSAPFTIDDGDNAGLVVHVDLYKVTGTLPVSASTGTVAHFEWFDGADWVQMGDDQPVDTGDGTFELRAPFGPSAYRIGFSPNDDSDYAFGYSGEFAISESQAFTAIGDVSLPVSPLIYGTVYGNGGLPLAGATVEARVDGGVTLTATTDSSGNYRLKSPVGQEYYNVAVARAPGYDEQFWDHSTYEVNSSVLLINEGFGWLRTGIDFSLTLHVPDAYGTTVDLGGNPVPSDVLLYRLDDGTGLYSPTAYAASRDLSSFIFSALPDGTYRAQFTDAVTNRPLPLWGTPANGGADTCYIEFGVSSVEGDVDLGEIALDTEAAVDRCGDPAWLDASDLSLTGTVLNIDDFNHSVVALLFSTDGSTGTLVDTAVVDPSTGAYWLDGIRAAGGFYVEFLTDDRDPFLDTYLGSSVRWWVGAPSASSDIATYENAIWVDPADTDTLSGHDLSIGAAVSLGGVVTGPTDEPIAGCVEATGADLGYSACIPTDGAGAFGMKLPVDDYLLHASDYAGFYVPQYWQNAATENDATRVGASSSTLDFALALVPPSLQVRVWDDAGLDPVTVHLYYEDENGFYQELQAQSSSYIAFFTRNHETGVDDGMIAGNYRIRFESATGDWMYVPYYTGGTVSAPSATIIGPVCFVDYALLGGDPGWFQGFAREYDGSAPECGPEPLYQGDVSGRLIETTGQGSDPIPGLPVDLYNTAGDDFIVTSDSNGEFSFSDVPNGTYYLTVQGTEPVSGDHSYVQYDIGSVVIAEGHAFGDIVLTRYGNVSGHIPGWDDSLYGGASVSVVVNDPVQGWVRALAGAGYVDSNGDFVVPGIDVDGQYSLWLDFGTGSGYAPSYLGGGIVEPGATFAGVAETDIALDDTAFDVEPWTTISGSVTFGEYPVSSGFVLAHIVGAPEYASFYVLLDDDGTYVMDVAAGYDYEVAAYAVGFYPQAYGGVNFENFGDAVDYELVAGVAGGTESIDFDLTPLDDVEFAVDVAQYDPVAEDLVDFTDVDVHLYKYITDGWIEVDGDVSNPSAYLGADGGGDYRLRFSEDGEWLAIDDLQWQNYLPPYDYSDEALDDSVCAYDFAEVPTGSRIDVGVVLNPDSSVGDCGPQETVQHYFAGGSLIDSPQFGGNPITTPQTVQLRNNDTGAVITVMSDSSGLFDFPSISAGTYTLTVLSETFTGSGHIYAERVVTDIVVDGNEHLGQFVLTQLGNIDVQVINYGASAMAGTTAQAFVAVTDGTGTHWQASGPVVAVSSTGLAAVPGVGADGSYTVFMDYPAGYVDGYLADFDAGHVVSAIGYAETDLGGLETVAYTTISGTVWFGASGAGGASVVARNLWGFLYFVSAASNGVYSVPVPAGYDYTLTASKVDLVSAQAAASVMFDPLTGIDFSLHYATFSTRLFDETSEGSALEPSAVVHLYRQVSGGWQEVASETGVPNVMWTNLSGAYRLRFSVGSEWRAITQYEWLNGANTAQTSGVVRPGSAVCFIDFGTLVPGAEMQTDAVGDPDAEVECAAEPAVVAPPAPPGSSGGTTRVVPTFFDDSAAAETGVVDQDASDDGAGGSDNSGSGDETTDEDEAEAPKPTPAVVKLEFGFWLALILALLVLTAGVVYIRRRS